MTELVNGLDTLEVAVLNSDGTVDETSWTEIENIEEGSVTLTSNADTKTTITPEDKNSPILTLYTPGDPDTYNFAMLVLSYANAQRFFNIIWDAATSKMTFLAKKKYAVLALRFTSNEQYETRARITFRKVQCNPSWKNTITKTGLLAIAVEASILSWKTTGGQDATMEVQYLDAEGEPIDSTPAPTTFNTVQTFASSVTDTDAGVTTTVPSTDADTKMEFNSVSSPIGTPVNMVLKLSTVSVASVDYPSDYNGHAFRFTDASGTIHNGVFTSGNVVLT